MEQYNNELSSFEGSFSMKVNLIYISPLFLSIFAITFKFSCFYSTYMLMNIVKFKFVK